MNIDLGSLFFNASIETGGGTPSWGTALGQSSPDYKLTYPGAADILIAMDYCYWPLSDSISCKLGKGGKEYKAIASQSIDSKYEITKAAVFYDVYVKVENRLIPVDKPFILLVTRENENTHKGRRTLKYSDSTSIGEFSNKDFYDAVQVQLGGPNVCWFAYAIDAVEQSKLIISIVKVSDTHESYANPETRKRTWMSLLPTSMQASFGTQNSFSFNISPSYIPSQIIYYGVPGCGKSHTITTMLKDEKVKDPTFSEENQVVRTTFHPEYTNADFIGQILPEVHEDSQGKSVVEYKLKPGPFAKILKQALHNPSRPFYLVIEEINRGNAAAIFGDVFQLLDRLKNGDTSKEPVGTDGFENHYGKGWSEYFVMNADVNAYIRDAKSDDELDTKSIDVSGIHFSSSTGLRLPPNLSIYATMNTSDQNVFTLDNAFQRRWDMELVSNTCKWNDEDHKKQAKLPIGDTDVRWETFRKAINSEISDGDFFNADDKQLGLFFIDAEGDKIDGKMFANKVLKYLWADVFKRDTGKIFKSENLSKVVEDFTGTDAFDKVFVEDFAQSLKNANDEIKNHE